MTSMEIRKILEGTFSDPADKEYWEEKLEEALRKEQTAEENAKYFRKMAVYDR